VIQFLSHRFNQKKKKNKSQSLLQTSLGYHQPNIAASDNKVCFRGRKRVHSHRKKKKEREEELPATK
jgi:hypothetical protein